MGKSIRVRLLAWYAAVLTAVVGGFAGLLYYEVRAARLAEIDAQLEATAAGLDAALRLFPRHELTGDAPPPKKGEPGGKKGEPGGKKGPPPPKPPPPDFAGPPPREHLIASLDPPGPPEARPRGMYFGVWRADWTALKLSGLPGDRGPPAAPPGRPTIAFRGPNRELAVLGPEESVILVGRPAGDVLAGLRTFALQLAATGLGVLAVGLTGGWWIARRIVRPIRAIADTASRISATHLSERIDDTRVDAELADLARVLNDTFERLEQAFERQARFTADASHELRTPLTVIRSQAELALSRVREPVEYQEALRTCLRAAARMTDLVDGLLTLARADAGLAGTRRVRLEWHRVVADAVDLCRPLADERKVRVTTKLDPAAVVGDAPALARVVANLVANGVQYNHPGGEVRVHLAVDGDESLLTVEDTGPGIPAEDQPHLFERFYRADKARSRATGGTGLGLAIARAVVESHGGAVGVKSEPGRGSTFWVRLPLAPPGRV